MIISSELTGKQYKSVEECLEDEKNFLRKKEEEKKAKEEHEKALNKAYEEAVAACERYFKLAGIEVDMDEDGWSIKTTSDISDNDDVFDLLYRLIF